jgi:hypothetical protein
LGLINQPLQEDLISRCGKGGAAQSAYLLFDVALPSQTSFQVIDGDKLVVQRGDTLAAWADSAGANNIDLIISYVVYTPAS